VPPAQPVAPQVLAAPPGAPALNTLDTVNMSIQRHDRVDLVSAAGGPLNRLVFGSGWQPAPGHAAVDLDASVIAFDAQGQKLAIVWHEHMTDFLGALQHTGDNQTGSAQGDAERILVELNRLPDHVGALVFTMNSASGQTFTDVVNAYCALSDDTGRVLLRYDLSDTQPSTAVLMAIVRRSGAGTWSLRAIGEFHDCRSARHLVDPAARQVSIY
jgi:stress response protein SCP2